MRATRDRGLGAVRVRLHLWLPSRPSVPYLLLPQVTFLDFQGSGEKMDVTTALTSSLEQGGGPGSLAPSF